MFGLRYFLSVCLVLVTSYPIAHATAPELVPWQGHWQVVELVIDGNVVPPDQVQYKLPSGGKIEVIDNAFIFKSPGDGKQHARMFRVDATQYPSSIWVTSSDGQTSRGIYRPDGAKLVICVSGPGVDAPPTDFSAPPGSGRMLMVMARPRTGFPTGEPKPQPALQAAAPPPPAAVPAPPAATPPPAAAPPPAAIPTLPAAAPQPPAPQVRALNDSELAAALIGRWRHNDGEGILLVTINGNGTFFTQREFKDTQVFSEVFVNTYVSSGRWQVRGGAVIFQVQSSTRVDKVNQTASLKVRTIDRNEVVYIDQLGRANRDVRVK